MNKGFWFVCFAYAVLVLYSGHSLCALGAEDGGGILEVESRSGEKQTLQEAKQESISRKRIRETLELDVTCMIPGEKMSRSSLTVKEKEKGTLLFSSAAVNISGELYGNYSGKKGSFQAMGVDISTDVTAVSDAGMKPLGPSKIRGLLDKRLELRKTDAKGREIYRLYIKVSVQ